MGLINDTSAENGIGTESPPDPAALAGCWTRARFATPNFDPQSLVGHLVYGLVLGVAFPFVRNL